MMTSRDRATLRMLLAELITVQDTVTHLNEKGEQYEGQTRHNIEIRMGIMDRIVAFCDARIFDDDGPEYPQLALDTRELSPTPQKEGR